MQVLTENIGRVIGKGGSTMRLIQVNAGVKMEVERESAGGSHVRRVTLRGTPAAVSVAKQMIEAKSRGDPDSKAFSAILQNNPVNPGTSKLLRVPDENVGRVIGRGGATIRQIQELTGCHVEVAKAPEPGSTIREITVTGSAAQIAQAEGLIMQKLSGDALPATGGGGGGGLLGAAGGVEIKVFVPSEYVGRYVWWG